MFGLVLEDSGLIRQAKLSGTKAGNAAGAAMSKGVTGHIDSLGGQLGKGFVQGLGLAGALGAANLASTAVGGVIDLIGDSLEAASALNETVSKGRQIFGEGAGDIEEWASTADTALGLSKRAAIDAASGFAGLFQTVDIGGDKAAEMAQRLTGLGSDLASFFNTDVQTALDAIKSGLAGESEPLRKYNVFLSETAVKAKAAALGLKPVNGQLTEGAKALARYELILDQTSAAQGDFARTSDGLANSQRSLNAQVENIKAELGQEFLPIARDLSLWAKDEAVPAIRDLLQAIKDAEPVFDALGFAFSAVRQQMGLGSMAMDQAKAKVKELQQAAAEAREALEEHRRGERESWTEAASTAEVAGDAIGDAADDYAARSKDASTTVRRSLKSIVAGFNETWAELTGTVGDAADDIFGPLERRGELAELQAQRQALGTIIRDPKSTKQEVADARRELLGIRRDIFELEGEMAGRGELALHSLEAFNDSLRAELKDATDEERASIMELIRLYGVLRRQSLDFPSGAGGLQIGDRLSGSGFSGTRAEGGPVLPGHRYLVGERGPEFFVPGDRGTILPMAGGSSLDDLFPQDWPGIRPPINIQIENVNLADAHDEFSMLQSLQFLAGLDR